LTTFTLTNRIKAAIRSASDESKVLQLARRQLYLARNKHQRYPRLLTSAAASGHPAVSIYVSCATSPTFLYVASRLRCDKCRKAGKRPAATLRQLAKR
jgi:hypothetical protein